MMNSLTMQTRESRGRFPFDKLVKFYGLNQINQAAEDSEKGITIKPIVRIGP